MQEPQQVVNPPITRRPSIGWRTIVRRLLVAAALVAVATILWLSRDALTPFIIGLVLAYLMLPLVDRLDNRIPRWAAILIDRFYDEASPAVQARVEEQVARIQQTAQQNATAYTQRVAEFLFSSVLRIFQTLTFLLGFLIIPFFLFYIMLDAERMPRAINRMLHPRIRDDFWNLLRIVDTVFGKYIRGQLTLGVIVGVMSFLGFMGLNAAGYNVQFTVLLALVAAIGELIPVVGPILSAIPAIIVGATDGSRTAIAVAILFIVIQQIENQVLVPRIVGNTLKLHAALLMALLVIASQIGGLFLVILVAPLSAIARDAFLYVHRRLNEPPIPPAAAIADILAEPDAAKPAPRRAAAAPRKPTAEVLDRKRTGEG